jgi:BlaI family penicillinase repressor
MTRNQDPLSRRERQIMDIIYRQGRASAADVLDNLIDPPSYSAVRAKLRILEEKGHLKHREQGPRYVYFPTISREKAKRNAIKHILLTFFEGSAENAVATLLDVSKEELSEDNLERLKQMIDNARKGGQ